MFNPSISQRLASPSLMTLQLLQQCINIAPLRVGVAGASTGNSLRLLRSPRFSIDDVCTCDAGKDIHFIECKLFAFWCGDDISKREGLTRVRFAGLNCTWNIA